MPLGVKLCETRVRPNACPTRATLVSTANGGRVV